MGLAILPAIFGELQGRCPTPRRSPEGPPGADRVSPRDIVCRADARLVVPALQVMSTLEHQTGLGEATANCLGGNDDGVGHTNRRIHGELDV